MRALWVLLLAVAPAPRPAADLAAQRFGYGVRPEEREALRKTSWDAWVAEQLAYEKITDTASDAAVDAVGTLEGTPAELMARFPKPQTYFAGLKRVDKVPPEIAAMVDSEDAKADFKEHKDELAAYYEAHGMQLPPELIATVQTRYFIRALTTQRQLYEEMVDFWLDHFNVFVHKDGLPYSVVAFERDAIRPHALGHFDELLRAVAESPAMLDYLDNTSNVRPGGPAPNQALPPGLDPTTCKTMDPKRVERILKANGKPLGGKAKKTTNGINENYARELLELHTLGVDGGYSQKDITEVARAFTGWVVLDPQGAAGCPQSGTSFFAPELHDSGDKTVLGKTIRSGGRDEGLAVLDLVAHHPSTARFIVTKLVRRFVSDDPPRALVDRAVKTFTVSGGDMREVMRVIATSDEAVAAAKRGDKVKRPFDLVVSAIRAVGATSDGVQPVKRWLGNMGQQPYGCATPNGYPERAAAWVNAGALVERLNFGLALASNQVKGTPVDLGALLGLDVAFGGAASADVLVDTVSERMLGRRLSDATRATVIASIDETQKVGDASSEKANVSAAKHDKHQKADPRLARVVGLVLGSPEFQHR